ncbi:ABC transporter permease [Arundinibacter roseus]|uniref:ABC transporter permease n=1 Tax=Arundinibacter roseus TaxID=2070510 RepID=A0A4R4JXM3_9BACT|nr:ABC transporter permease [Arundinibacter roseus]TDB59544.1 ABC transporter permease [Arundinibacter roseus]
MNLTKHLQDRVLTLGFTTLLLCVLMTIVFPTQFATVDNFSQILLNLSIDTIVAVGMMILMIAGMFDLSVGSTVAFSGGMAGYLMYYHQTPVFLAILAGLLGSLVIGFVNGWFIAKGGINPMIQTLAMMGIVRGFALMLSGAGIQNFPYEFIYIGQSRLLKLQAPVWYMIGTVLVMAWLVNKTVFFRRYYFIGGNEKAARLSGIEVEKMKIWAFVISALLAGIAGILLSSRLGAALSTSGRGLELRVITAVILGGASLSGGYGKIGGAFLGALFMAIVNNALIIGRISGYWQEVILGSILITAVGLDQWLIRRSQRVKLKS